MAEGGDFGYDDPDLDYNIDHDDDDDQEVNTTRPFHPGAASTPYHGVVQHEMPTMQHEQSGNFLHQEDKQNLLERAKMLIKGRFPKVGPIGFSKKGARTDIVSFGQKRG